MSYESGGRSNKYGNRFENNWVIQNLVDVIDEKLTYVEIEPLGEDEPGVDLWVVDKSGNKEGQQCKGRNGSKDSWTISDLREKRVLDKWKKQLERDNSNTVSLVSPVPFNNFRDLCDRAKNTTDYNTFYKYQIQASDKKMQELFHSFCKEFGLDVNNEKDLRKALYYLQRIRIINSQDSYDIKELVIRKIDLLYAGEPELVYEALLDLVFNDDILSKHLDAVYVSNYLSSKGYYRLPLANDTRILPVIDNLNKLFLKGFNCISTGLVEREEAKMCFQLLDESKSVIMHGKAGTGKSGSVINLIEKLEKAGVPYIAINLAKHMPLNNISAWGNSLGFEYSLSQSIDAAYKDQRAIIILDQLDALRWTQIHSAQAMEVCVQLLSEIEIINLNRDNPIQIVFVCRSYDYKNDTSIRNLFYNNRTAVKSFNWEELEVTTLPSEVVRRIVGETYDQLNSKLKELLSYPSNIYIWERIEKDNEASNIKTTYQLINHWCQQIDTLAAEAMLDTTEIRRIRNVITEYCERESKVLVPQGVIKAPANYINYLQSSGLLCSEGNSVKLFHQSVLDFFMADLMIEKYYRGEDLKTIIGDKQEQKPNKRYQFQMFLQQVGDDSEQDLIAIGDKLLSADDFRFSFKYAFLELFSEQCPGNDLSLDFVNRYLNNEKWAAHFINAIINGNSFYIHCLRDTGRLDYWLANENESLVIGLLRSINTELDEYDAAYIREHVLSDNNNDWTQCFGHHVYEDCDAIFKLRLELFDEHNISAFRFVDIKREISINTKRAILIIKAIFDKGKQKDLNTVYVNTGRIEFDKETETHSEHEEIIKTLLPTVPIKDDWSSYLKWAHNREDDNLERVVVDVLLQALSICAVNSFEEYRRIIESQIKPETPVHNEIILRSFLSLDTERADWVIKYIISEFENVLFENTSGNGNELYLAKEVLSRFSNSVNNELFSCLESKIIHYIPPDAADRFKRRIRYRKEHGVNVYWKYWGDLQRELLPSLPEARTSKQAKELLLVLQRDERVDNIYNYVSEGAGFVISPVNGKSISTRAWKQIITNRRIPYGFNGFTETAEGIVESNVYAFARSFGIAVKEDPEELTKLLLNCEEGKVLPDYIDSALSALVEIGGERDIDPDIIECLTRKYGYDYHSHRAQLICEIIAKKPSAQWSDYMLTVVSDVAIHHTRPSSEDVSKSANGVKDKLESGEMLTYAINSARGQAAITIAKLIKADPHIISRYKEAIERLANDSNEVVRYASLFPLMASFDLNRAWSGRKIMQLLSDDDRNLNIYGIKHLLYSAYEEFEEEINSIVRKGLCSDDDNVARIASYCVMEFYIVYEAFTDLWERYPEMKTEQKKAMLDMLITYAGEVNYSEKAKKMLIELVEDHSNEELTQVWERLFERRTLDVEADQDLIRGIIKNCGVWIIREFNLYLVTTGGMKKYEEDIINMAYKVSKGTYDYYFRTHYLEELLKTIITIYDSNSDMRDDRQRMIATKCLDVWDYMYENDLGMARTLSRDIMDM